MTQETPNTLRGVMEAMPASFNSQRAGSATATIQFNFSGNEPGNWIVKVAEGKCEVSEGTTDNPNVTINAPSDVWLKITRKEMDGATAFMSGQFTFTGDMGVLMQMQTWFQ